MPELRVGDRVRVVHEWWESERKWQKNLIDGLTGTLVAISDNSDLPYRVRVDNIPRDAAGLWAEQNDEGSIRVNEIEKLEDNEYVKKSDVIDLLVDYYGNIELKDRDVLVEKFRKIGIDLRPEPPSVKMVLEFEVDGEGADELESDPLRGDLTLFGYNIQNPTIRKAES